MPAVPALAAEGHVDAENAVSDLVAGDLGADLGDLGGELVAEDLLFGLGPLRAAADGVQVAAADGGVFCLEQHVLGAYLGDIQLLEAQVVLSVVNDGFHFAFHIKNSFLRGSRRS